MGKNEMQGHKKAKVAVVDFLLLCGCMAVINAVWETIEIACYGMAVPSLEDTVIGGLFSLFLWGIVRRWNKEVAEDG